MSTLQQEILDLLKKRAAPENDAEYINPHFLTEITGAIRDFYELEDDVVDKWVEDMWSY